MQPGWSEEGARSSWHRRIWNRSRNGPSNRSAETRERNGPKYSPADFVRCVEMWLRGNSFPRTIFTYGGIRNFSSSRYVSGKCRLACSYITTADSRPEPVSRYSIRRTVDRKFSSREGRSRRSEERRVGKE